jgi:hypothetical protein
MQRFHHLFMGRAEELALGSVITTGQLQNLLVAASGNRSAFYSRHNTDLLFWPLVVGNWSLDACQSDFSRQPGTKVI